MLRTLNNIQGDWRNFSRNSKNPISVWWWTIDKFLFFSFIFLMGIGCALSLASTPLIAVKLGYRPYYFFEHQMTFYVPTFFFLIALSLLSPKVIRRIAFALFFLSLIAMVVCLFIGPDIKGAHRWLRLYGFALQPSEFVKPAFIVFVSWLFHLYSIKKKMIYIFISLFMYAAIAYVLILQPDFGQLVLVTCVFGIIIFVFGASWKWILASGFLSCLIVVLCYMAMPHVRHRIDGFLYPKQHDTYQVNVAMDSFASGGLLGRGPGEGIVKKKLPDAHTDFVFSVAAEEYGALIALLIVGIFCFISVRGLMHAIQENDNMYHRLSIVGLISLFSLQAVINLAVNVHIVPPKGMTLPFLSYGGSSLLATAVGLGMALSFTRKDAVFMREE